MDTLHVCVCNFRQEQADAAESTESGAREAVKRARGGSVTTMHHLLVSGVRVFIVKYLAEASLLCRTVPET